VFFFFFFEIHIQVQRSHAYVLNKEIIGFKLADPRRIAESTNNLM